MNKAMHKSILEDILNSEFESVSVRLHERASQLYKEGKLTKEQADLIQYCVKEADNPWLSWLYAGDDDEDEMRLEDD